MSGRLPRLRALRPRAQQPHQQLQPRPKPSEQPHKEGNLKETQEAIASPMKDYEDDNDEDDDDNNDCTDEHANANDEDDGGQEENEEACDDDDDDDDDEEEEEEEEEEDGAEGKTLAESGQATVNTDDSQHVGIARPQQSYECKTCNPARPMPNLKAYLEHLKKEHKQKGKLEREAGNHCPACTYVAHNLKDLETHQRVQHLKRRFFRCSKCAYVTHVRARYTKHVKYHSMPMIKCDSCDFRTPYKWNLDRHTRNHGGGGAFQCRACNFTADIRQSLTVHETNHHEPPVTPIIRKGNAPFERKPRNIPKRYNQVGASDFRESYNMSGSSTASASTGDSFLSDHSLDEKRSAIANAECIALKCEEKGCQFITAWDSEMQRHLAECHAPLTPTKSRKPLPMLIPLSPMGVKRKNNACSSTPTTLLKVPRVRVRPELAQIARDTELAKLYGSKEGGGGLKKEIGSAADLFEKKNAPFFDKLKEKLTTATSISNGIPEVAVDGASTQPSGRRVFKCPHCPFWASTASRFHVHIVGHLNRKPFECSLCAYRSNWRWDITKHIKLKAAKDPVHMTARVLMTDETGRRNYSKYNKYLAQIEQQSWDDQNMEEPSMEGQNSEEPPNKVLILNSKEYPQAPDMATNSLTVLSSPEGSRNSTIQSGLRPPPPLKAAAKNRGQSLLKTSPISSQAKSGNNSAATSVSTIMVEDNKRTLWKCKRCNFRDSNKETVVSHVKSHYDTPEESTTTGTNAFGCGDCPFSAPDAATLSMHRVHHRPNLEAIFKCYLCPYYVSTKAELLDHVRLHGEELAVVHQQSSDYYLSASKSMATESGAGRLKEENAMEQVIHITTQNNAGGICSASKDTPPPPPPPPLLLDTRALPEAPLVWVSKPDGSVGKMLKCRHCPFVCARRAEVCDHESMHVDAPSQGPIIACTDCSFTCTRREVMIAHTDMHSGSLGTVHCLVDSSRTDAQQLTDLTTLLGLSHPPTLAHDPDLRDTRLVHCCAKCPARFLCEKELRIHLRYHSTELAYSCQWCSYAARQPAHLLAHQKAHSMEYQERTKYLLSLYGSSQRYPPPATACVEAAGTDTNDPSSLNVAWIVVEVSENSSHSFHNQPNTAQRTGNQVFTCAKCPARYFKLDALEYHMTLHGSNNRFKCTECDYSSKTAQNLVKHQVVHRRIPESHAPENIVPNITSPPDPQFGHFMRGNPNFVYPGYLRNGRMKEKRYKCHKCPSAFEKREQYRVHLTLHGAKQRYRCDTCDYSVKYYANYIQHLKKHQANAEAQASRRQFEDDTITIDNEVEPEVTTITRSGKSLKSPPGVSIGIGSNSASTALNYAGAAHASNQDKQSMILLQKRGLLCSPSEEIETLRCQSCPFSTCDKDAMDAHKRRHGIERMTPSCPHCDYIPRKDENVGDHIKLHFTRLYKPESYLIIEMLTLTMKKIPTNKKDEKQKPAELLFKEYAEGRYLPVVDTKCFSPAVNSYKEKVIVDPNTGEPKQHVKV